MLDLCRSLLISVKVSLMAVDTSLILIWFFKRPIIYLKGTTWKSEFDKTGNFIAKLPMTISNSKQSNITVLIKLWFYYNRILILFEFAIIRLS